MKTDQLYEYFKESTGVTTDSRNVQKGEIFFALWGESYNGNQFAEEALNKGALLAVIDDPQYESSGTFLVDDCLLELQSLASHHRKQLNIPVIAITGTNGKTTTKELVAAILAKKLKVHFTKGNLNNHIGVPLTILSAPSGTKMMIIEMGANHVGEIRTLCNIAKPDYGIITNIGKAHLEGFGSVDALIRTKIELYEYLRKVNGIAIYNDKNPLLTEKIFKIINRAVPYSDPTGIDLLVDEVPSDLNLCLTATYHHQTYRITTNLFGKYNIENVKAAIAAGLFFEVEMNDVVDAVQNYQPANNRSQIKITKNNTLICDSYNANPTSMISALDSFVQIQAERKLVILGDMLELGEKSDEEHLNLIKSVQSLNLENVILVGNTFHKYSSQKGFISFSDVNKLADYLKAEPVQGRHILIKGSRAIGLEKIYDLL
jgi:UDP-N-acetylmuramoyl-tripeptide--D-alanyl-D-alanine ligase